MVLGVGVDIVEIKRVGNAVTNPRFALRVFTEHERNYCESRRTQRHGSYAARFAAKEAIMKALGTGLSKGSWLDIEIRSGADGKPEVKLFGHFALVAERLGATEILLSMSHSREYAVAQALVYGRDRL